MILDWNASSRAACQPELDRSQDRAARPLDCSFVGLKDRQGRALERLLAIISGKIQLVRSGTDQRKLRAVRERPDSTLGITHRTESGENKLYAVIQSGECKRWDTVIVR
jgi:hypothetical protein